MASFISLDQFEEELSLQLNIFDEELTMAVSEGMNKGSKLLANSVKNNVPPGLAKQVKAIKAKPCSNGAIISTVTFKGSVKSGWDKSKDMAATTAAFWLEYGTNGEYPQPPRPWIDKSVNQVEGEVLECIQKAHDELVERLGISL